MTSPIPLPLTDAEMEAFRSGHAPAGAVLAQDLDLADIRQPWGNASAGHWVFGPVPFDIGGQRFSVGVGTHSVSRFNIHLQGNATRFAALVGIDINNVTAGAPAGSGSVRFEAWLDGKLAAITGILRGNDPPAPFAVDLRGAQDLCLVVNDGGDGTGWDHAAWAGACLYLTPGAKLHRIARPQVLAELVSASPVRTPQRKPALHGPTVVGGSPGKPFLHLLGASGTPAVRYGASGLPAGLSLDAETGAIKGRLPAEPGEYVVQLTATNAQGTATAPLRIVCGHRKLARTPPMGWNSWNVWGLKVDAAKIRAACDLLVESGLAGLGYQYVNIDDAWEGVRDATGVLQPNERFGDIAQLAEYVHGRNLKLGIYSSPGPKTCGGYAGSYRHEALDARTWASWGIDLLKYDWCSYGEVIAGSPSLEQAKEPYRVMRAALDACDRDLMYSLCQYGMCSVWRWGDEPAVGGNLWRIAGDITDNWQSICYEAEHGIGLTGFAGPGHWNDPDMLAIGWLGWGKEIRPTMLSAAEQVSHFSMWAMLASPLLIGCDLTRLDDFTLDVLGNPEVIAVDQDPLGVPARRIAKREVRVAAEPQWVWASGDTSVEIWARPLADGSQTVALINRAFGDVEIAVDWQELGLTGEQPVRDLWQRSDRGRHRDGYATTVPPHGTALLKVG